MGKIHKALEKKKKEQQHQQNNAQKIILKEDNLTGAIFERKATGL